MTTYFVDKSVKKSGDGLTWETAFKTEDEAYDLMERDAPQRRVVVITGTNKGFVHADRTK